MIPLEEIRPLLALGITFAATGLAAGLILVPEHIRFVERAGLSLALAVPATVGITAIPLSLGQFDSAAFTTGLLVLAVPGAVIALVVRTGVVRIERPGGMARRRLKVGRPSWRLPWDRPRLLEQRIAAERSAPPLPGRFPLLARLVLGALGLVLAWLTVIEPQLRAVGPDGLPEGTTVWYYWRLVQEVSAAHALPASIGEWGQPRPFPLWWLATTIHGAATVTLAGDSSLRFMDLYRMAIVVLTLAAAFMLLRRWLPGWWAAVAAVLFLSADRLSSKLVAYRPETFGLMLVLWSGWLIDIALARRSLRWAVAAGVVCGTAYLAHAESWILTGPLWGGIVVARGIPVLRALLGRGAGRASRRDRLRPLAAAFLVLVTAVACFGAVVVGTGVASGVGVRLEDPGSAGQVAAEGDITWAFYLAIRGEAPGSVPPPTDFWDPALQDLATAQPFGRLDVSDPEVVGLLLLVMLVTLTGARGLPRPARRGLLVWFVFGVTVVVAAVAIWLLYTTYVPERAGPRRILPYYVLPLAVVITVCAWVVARRLADLLARSFGRLPRAIALAIASAIATVPLLTLTPLATGNTSSGELGLSAAGYEAYLWMRTELPPDAVILANVYTDGALGALSGRRGWLDGRAPYLEPAPWPAEAVASLLDAQEYFLQPTRARVARDPAIDYVLVGKNGNDLGGGRRLRTSEKAFERARDLSLLRTWGAGQIRLYEVLPEAP